MTKIINGKLYIQNEGPGECELCGAESELRPYGPNGENICFPCGRKNPEATTKAFLELVNKVDTVVLSDGETISLNKKVIN